jgi:hypothetical protein
MRSDDLHCVKFLQDEVRKIKVFTESCQVHFGDKSGSCQLECRCRKLGSLWVTSKHSSEGLKVVVDGDAKHRRLVLVLGC